MLFLLQNWLCKVVGLVHTDCVGPAAILVHHYGAAQGAHKLGEVEYRLEGVVINIHTVSQSL